MQKTCINEVQYHGGLLVKKQAYTQKANSGLPSIISENDPVKRE